MSPTPILKPSLNLLPVSNPPLKMRKLFLLSFLLCFLLLSSTFMESVTAKPVFCYGECKRRCSRAGYRERCMKYCGICCVKCKCVPSGTYGNKHECPCYRNLRNARGKPKCH